MPSLRSMNAEDGTMRTLKCLVLLALLYGGLAGTARVCAQVPLPEMGTQYGSTSLSQNLVVSVNEINVVSVSGNLTLTINSATAGAGPDDATNTTTTYNITTNGTNKKITGQLDVNYASGLSLAVDLAAPTGGTSQGQKTLSTTAQDLVTTMSKLVGSTLTITYTASATPSAAPNGSGETNIVTLTLTDM